MSAAHGQVRALIDMSQLSMPILMYDRDGKSTVMTLEQLLPMSFGPEKLWTTDEVQSGLAQQESSGGPA